MATDLPPVIPAPAKPVAKAPAAAAAPVAAPAAPAPVAAPAGPQNALLAQLEGLADAEIVELARLAGVSFQRAPRALEYLRKLADQDPAKLEAALAQAEQEDGVAGEYITLDRDIKFFYNKEIRMKAGKHFVTESMAKHIRKLLAENPTAPRKFARWQGGV
jgi:hypothetical protein